MDDFANFSELYGFVTEMVCLFGVLLNAVLLVIVINKTPARLQKYNPVLTCICLANMLYEASTYAIHSRLRVFESAIYYDLNAPFVSLHHRFLLLTCSWFTSHFVTLLVAVPFVVRYCDVCHKWQMGKTMLSWLVMIEYVFASCLTLNEYMTLWPTVDGLSRHANLTTFPCVHCVPVFNVDDTIAHSVSSTLPLYGFIVALHYAIIAVFHLRVSKALKTRAQLRKVKVPAQHAQFNAMLTNLARGTLVFALAPSFALIVGLFFSAFVFAHALAVSHAVRSTVIAANAVVAIATFKPYTDALQNKQPSKTNQSSVFEMSSAVSSRTGRRTTVSAISD